MILLAACILQLLGGIPDLDADDVPMKRLRIAGTAYPPERVPLSDYWKRIKEAHGVEIIILPQK